MAKSATMQWVAMHVPSCSSGSALPISEAPKPFTVPSEGLLLRGRAKSRRWRSRALMISRCERSRPSHRAQRRVR